MTPDEIIAAIFKRNEIRPGSSFTHGACIEMMRAAIAEERQRCANLYDALGSAEQAEYGLTRGTQNYFRARNSIAAGEKPELHYAYARYRRGWRDK